MPPASERENPGDGGEGAPPGQPAFRELMRRHAGFVRRTAASAGVSAAHVDDIAQAVLLLLWKRLRRGGVFLQLRAWLGTVTRRLAWAHNRAEKERGELPDGYVVLDEERVAPGAGEIVEVMAEIRLVREIVSEIEPARRVVLQRYELDGDRMQDIADDLGIPLMTAYNRRRLAREDFERLLRARLRRDRRRRRVVFLPFLSQRSEAVERGGGWAAAGCLLCALLALLLLDTRLWPVALPQATPAVAATAGPSLPVSPDPPPVPVGPAAVPVKRSDPGPSRHGATPAPPRKRRNVETARILLDTADRMAAEGRTGAAEEALRLYSIHAPDDPMPATRAAVPVPRAQPTNTGPRAVSTSTAPRAPRSAPPPPPPVPSPQTTTAR